MTKSFSIFVFLTLFFLGSFGQTKKDSLFVFIGEIIEVKKWPQPIIPDQIDTTIINGATSISTLISFNMDSRYIAKYKILQKVFGKFQTDTIEFIAFDHYGTPAFSKYKYVMLFVSNENGNLFHEKYQYFDVYKAKNGRWASSYKVGDYKHDYNKNTSVKPEIIDFENEVSYNSKGRSEEDLKIIFPSPYYKIVGDKAVAVWGNYIEQLFELKKTGILKARDIFD